MEKSVLQELVTSGLSSYKISKKLELSQTTVRYWLKKFNLKTQPYKIASQKSSRYVLCGKCHKRKLRSKFYKRADRKDSVMYYCIECFNRHCMDRWKDRKIQAILLKGNKCERCSLDLQESHYSVFEFHHKNPNNKEYDWRKLRSYSMERITKELDKCMLVCANCHRLIHAELSARRDLNS